MDTSRKMHKIATYLGDLGWQVAVIDLDTNTGDTRLEILAQQVAETIDRTFAADEQIDLLGFSMGGLVTRYYVQRLGGIAAPASKDALSAGRTHQRVGRLITISTPHQGTLAANFSTRTGCKQMRPDSDFMTDLNRDVEMLNRLKFTSIWTPFDLIILPPSSSQLGIGKELQIPVLTHPWMVSDRRTLAAIYDALIQPIESPI
jgi:triacylglycerol lipase